MKIKLGAVGLAAAFGAALAFGAWAAEVDKTATGAIAGNADVSTTISAMNATKTEVDELRKLSSIKSLKVMKLDPAGKSDAQFTAAMNTNKTDTDSLRTAIQANADLQAQLKAQNVTVESIIAIDVDANGNVIVYTQG
jgi:hypothetical protein